MADNRFRFQARGLMSGRRRKRESYAGRIVAGVLLVILFLILFFSRGNLSGAFWDRMGPLSSVRNSVANAWSVALSPFYFKAALVTQNNTLLAELSSAQADVADRNALYAENIALKSQLGRSDTSVNAILAAVIARPPGVPYDTLIIDAGSNVGITPNDLVAGGEGALIGYVTDVYTHSARVVLFSSASLTHQGLLRGTIPLEVNGTGAGTMSAEVPSNTDVAAGDTVTFPGIAAGVSAVVAHVEEPQGGSFKMLNLSLPANVFSLQFVSVWRGRKALPELSPAAATSTPSAATSTKH